MDRGWAIAVLLVAVTAVAIIKPWAPATVPADPAHADAAASLHPAGSAPTAAATAPAGLAMAASLAKSGNLLVALPLPGAGGSWVAIGSPDGPAIELLDVLPVPAELGEQCAGGAMLGEGSDAIGVMSAGVPTRPLSVERLFAGLPAVEMPFEAPAGTVHGLALAAARDVLWAPGYYALTVELAGGPHVVPFCVGRMLRDVDYSLIVYVPANADSRAARRALLAEFGQP